MYWIVGMALAAVGAAVVGWSVWPAPGTHAELALGGDALVSPVGASGGRIEGRTIRLDYPGWIRLDGTGQASLEISPSRADEQRQAKGVNVEAETALDLAGAEVSPGDVVSAALLAGRADRFDWQIVPRVEGALEGRAWVYLRFVPTDGSADQRKPVSAQPVAIRVVSLLGMGEGTARWVGGSGIAIGVLVPLLGVLQGRKRVRRKRPGKRLPSTPKHPS
jgi:hypothetical protein